MEVKKNSLFGFFQEIHRLISPSGYVLLNKGLRYLFQFWLVILLRMSMPPLSMAISVHRSELVLVAHVLMLLFLLYKVLISVHFVLICH